jgi:predicted acylesterase/phospholipase RssA
MSNVFVSANRIFLAVLSVVLALTAASPAQASAESQQAAHKKFHRALILAGGGVDPGVGLGIIDGLRANGDAPDLVITSCGSSMAAGIYNSYPEGAQALQFAKSYLFYDLLAQVKTGVPNILVLKNKFDTLRTGAYLPDLFQDNALSLKDQLAGDLPVSRFRSSGPGPRFILVAARAAFGPNQSVPKLGPKPMFREVFFTDEDTAKALEGFPSMIKRSFPRSQLSRLTEVVTDVTPEQAGRASISDPFLINPAEIRGQYYFTGASDLFPIELAEELADEVVATYPENLFSGFKLQAMQYVFGYDANQRLLDVVRTPEVQWIDTNGSASVTFDPKPFLLGLTNGIPHDPADFAAGIQKQYNFGYERARESVEARKAAHGYTLDNIRKPLGGAK